MCDSESAELVRLHIGPPPDPTAFSKLYDLHWRAVRRCARAAARLWRAPGRPVETDYDKKEKNKDKVPLTKDEDRLSEICSDTWLEVVRSLRTFDVAQSFRGWIRGITENVAAEEVRKFQRERGKGLLGDLADELGDAGVPVTKQHRELEEDVEAALRCLNDEEYQVVRLKFFKGLKLAEIGAKLGMSPTTATERLQSAHKKLRPHMMNWADHGRAPRKKK
jgi:RNA polymerase sigma factor (sigma-70 family)